MKRSILYFISATALLLVTLYFGCSADLHPFLEPGFDPGDTNHCVPEDSVYSFEALDLHWNSAEDGCGTTVSSLLRSRSLVPVVYKDSAKCIISSGKWIDAYGRDTLRLAMDVVADRVVPLPDAYASGGYAWNQKQWLIFYNDTTNLELTTHAYVNSKKEQSIYQWQPVGPVISFEYKFIWRTIKKKYRLRASRAENNFLRPDTIALVDYRCKE